MVGMTIVNKKFLNTLADDIYNPKNRSFMKLCSGSLQSGKDGRRQMHCGLGELYFAMTGRHPATDGVFEDDVIEKAVELSTFGPQEEKARKALSTTVEKLKKQIRATALPSVVQNDLLNGLDGGSSDAEIDLDDSLSIDQQDFRDALNEIPEVNDSDGALECSEYTCAAEYRSRAKRVAEKLRAAAKCLPA